MTQEEKFAIWDATHPEVREVRAYLDRMCGKTPLPLVYLYPKEQCSKVVTDFLPEEKDHLVGILINENTMLYLRAVTFKDMKCVIGDRLLSDIRENDVNNFVKKQFTNMPHIRVATKKDVALVDKVHSKLFTTLEILDYHGIKLPKPCWEHLGRTVKNSNFINYWDGEALLYYYLKDYGDLLVFSDYTDDSLVKETVRQEYFQSARA